MNTNVAKTIMQRAAQLTEVVATFQATYGRSYQLDVNCCKEAKELADSILNIQTQIARLLDEDSVKNPHFKVGEWWKRQDAPDTGVVQEMVGEISHLIACCAYFAADPNGREWSYAVRSAQSTIAGFLHPVSRQASLTIPMLNTNTKAG